MIISLIFYQFIFKNKKGPSDENTDWLLNLPKSKEEWIVCGDFNAHSPFWERDCQSVTNVRLVENIVDSSLLLLNDGSITRIPDISTHKATSIDLSLVSPDTAAMCSWEVEEDPLGSDHLPIILKLDDSLLPTEDTKDPIPKFCYEKADWSKFESLLRVQNLSFSDIETLDEFYERFTSTVIAAANQSIPKRKSYKGGKHTGNVWWNQTCADAVKQKRTLYKIWLKKNLNLLTEK